MPLPPRLPPPPAGTEPGKIIKSVNAHARQEPQHRSDSSRFDRVLLL
jgi:hypothetical protein